MLFGDTDFSVEQHEIEKYWQQITSCTKKKTPEYLPVLQEMNESMVTLFAATLIYWNRRLSFFPYIDKFIETKIVECLSFWSGYMEAGGHFEYDENKKPGDLLRTNHTAREAWSQSTELIAVIPIGSVSSPIATILQNTLTTLEHHAAINKVLCIFDGCEPTNLKFNSFNKVKVTSIPQKRGPAYARNLGIAEALNDTSDLLLLDSDISISTQYLNELLIAYYKKPFEISCPKIIGAGSSWWDQYHDLCGTLNGRYFKEHRDQLFFGTTSCMMVPNQILQSGVRFCTDFDFAGGEDIDFCLKALSNGFDINPVDHVKIRHWYGYKSIEGSESENWNKFKERFSRYGRGEVMVLERFPQYYDLLAQSKERPSSETLFS
jgi:GT2 family glycosyltransferase